MVARAAELFCGWMLALATDGPIRWSVRSFAGGSSVRVVPKLGPLTQRQSLSPSKQPVIVPYRPSSESLTAIPPNTRPSIPIVPGAL